MLYIRDPYTGEMRDQTEYNTRSEAHVTRPINPAEFNDKEWGDYLFFYTNAKGIHFERWVSFTGHRKWFNVIRNTITDEILATYRPDEDVVAIINKLGISKEDIKSPYVLAKMCVKSTVEKASVKKRKGK